MRLRAAAKKSPQKKSPKKITQKKHEKPAAPAQTPPKAQDPAHPGMKDKDERLEQVAQELFGKPFAELGPRDRLVVGGKVGGALRGGELAEPEKAPPEPEVAFGQKNE